MLEYPQSKVLLDYSNTSIVKSMSRVQFIKAFGSSKLEQSLSSILNQNKKQLKLKQQAAKIDKQLLLISKSKPRTYFRLLLKFSLFLPIIKRHVVDQLLLVNETVTVVVQYVEKLVKSHVVSLHVLQRRVRTLRKNSIFLHVQQGLLLRHNPVFLSHQLTLLLELLRRQ